MLFKQLSRLAKITSPLGPDALLLKDMGGGEELGRLFNYESVSYTHLTLPTKRIV